MTEHQKQRIDQRPAKEDRINRLLDIYFTDANSLTHTAGWHQESPHAKMIIYGGFVPPGSGNDLSNVTMINEIEYLKAPHALMPMARELVNNLLRLNNRATVALLASRFYVNCYTDVATNTVKVFKDTTRAELIGQSAKQYRLNVKKGYDLAIVALALMEAGLRLASIGQENKKSA